MKKKALFFLMFISCYLIFSQSDVLDVTYKRSSLYALMLSEAERVYQF